MIFFSWLLGFSLFVLALPVMVLLAQVLAAFLPQKKAKVFQGSPRSAVLVPAHNEASGLSVTLESLKKTIVAGDRILVVADNCTDETADVARSCGVEVIERFDLENRGKGFALDFGIRHLSINPPEVLIIVDADCQVTNGSLSELAAQAKGLGRPVQALNLMNSPERAGLSIRLAEFAWRLKNMVRPLGWKRLGFPCQLMGTGMAFPWEMTGKMSLANGHIAEDMKLGVDLALKGCPPFFYPSVLVSSQFPSTDSAIKSQRTRWEHGHLSMLLSDFPRLFFYAMRNFNYQALGLALDLMVPPMALLAGLLFIAGIGAVVFSQIIGFVVIFAFALLVVLAWFGWGRSVVSLSDLALVPFYIFKKIPVYVSFLFKRQSSWIRTKRD